MLPLRAFQNPLLNWGNPSTWHRFIFDFLRSQYLGSDATDGLLTHLQQAWFYLKTVFMEFPGFLVLAIGGAWLAYQLHKMTAVALLSMWSLLSLAIVFYIQLVPDRFFLIKDYALSGEVFLLIFTAWGLELFLAQEKILGRRLGEGLVVGLLVTFLMGSGIYRYVCQRQTNYTYTYDYVRNAFKSVPRNAMYFCKGDSLVFPSWYFQWVLGIREDIAMVGVDGIPMEWIRRNLSVTHKGLKVPRQTSGWPIGNESVPSLIKWIVDNNPGREKYFSYNQIVDGVLPGTQLVPYGVADKGFDSGENASLDENRADRIWDILCLRHIKTQAFQWINEPMIGSWATMQFFEIPWAFSMKIERMNLGQRSKSQRLQSIC